MGSQKIARKRGEYQEPERVWSRVEIVVYDRSGGISRAIDHQYPGSISLTDKYMEIAEMLLDHYTPDVHVLITTYWTPTRLESVVRIELDERLSWR